MTQENCRCNGCDAEDGKVSPVCEPCPCKFIKKYIDSRGWVYFVRSGLGENQFKAFYQKPGKGAHAYKNTPWQERADDAQTDLNELAKKKGWQEYND